MATTQKQKIADLCAILTQVEDPKDMRALLEDLCTQKEVENMAERIFAATLSRVSRSLQNGTGYKKQLKK